MRVSLEKDFIRENNKINVRFISWENKMSVFNVNSNIK